MAAAATAAAGKRYSRGGAFRSCFSVCASCSVSGSGTVTVTSSKTSCGASETGCSATVSKACDVSYRSRTRSMYSSSVSASPETYRLGAFPGACRWS